MGELIENQENLSKKEALGAYVHDMVDLEIRALSLRETAKESRKKAEEEELKANDNYTYWKRKKTEIDNTVSTILFRKNTLTSEECSKKTWSDFFNTGFAAGLILFSLLFIILGIIVSFAAEFWTSGAIFFAIPLGIWLITIIIVGLTSGNTYICDLEKLDTELEELKPKCEQSKHDLANAEKELAEAQTFSKELIAHADKLDKNAAEVESALQKNYALNLIPPDYRRLQCLVWIDYAFRNDQVDTMREATLQCDNWVRHNDVMTALRELAENIRSVAVLLDDMNANIAMMNQDLLNIAQAQEKQLSETKSARYAMESVKRSTEKLEWYEDLKYRGAFK
ncbi:MAG: ABC transporter permease [Clostridia bacterium]|nr:ABC transporter permease [Clostridia bacterium]